MDWDLAKVLNLLGVVLEFVSFWFAAPEILGEERLRALERRVERGIVLLLIAMVIMTSLAGMIGLGGQLLALLMGEEAMEDWGWVGGIALMAGMGMWLVVMYEQRVLPRLLQVLADDTRIRQRSLAVGAVLFMIAFLCQFTAALLDISGP